ncbi:signal peptide peptidase-like 2B [Biomphalaria pfeifferi]|uniref:Signal peptide peptidase-like 2B n=1 Tax=Biomphalaria pfeifferi TaxID=112525 RepID=A0AAD8B868_BIOPF|nr:signal peptide peptidase-like 2B [Biomphalaria pfeifferi]
MKTYLLFTLISLVWINLIEIVASGGNALLDVSSADKVETFCINYNSQYQSLPASSADAVAHVLSDLSWSEGCTLQDFPPSQQVKGTTVALIRGNCTFIQKASMVESLQGYSALIVDNKNSTKTPVPGGNASDYKFINITVSTISWADYNEVLLHKQPVSVKLYAPTQPFWDANMFVIVIFSTIFVMLGAGWAAVSEKYSYKRLRRRVSNSNSSNLESPVQASSQEQQFTVWMVVIWFAVICAVIILLYFFYDVMVYFFIAMFCLAGSYSLYQCLLPVWSHIVPLSYDIPLNRFPCIKMKVKLRSFLLYMPCLTLAIFWAIERHSSYAWVIQDLLGASFCVFFIQNLRLPNLKVIAVLLILLLLYDVFFVFITPLITKDGDSIMESVATGGSSHSKESLPMVFLIPLLGDSPLTKCRDRSYSLLGFGDIIIPGLLVSYNAVFDIRSGSRMVYYVLSSVAYLCGMIICMISLVFMNSGQPALLYLVPCTLLTTVVIALIRGELRKLIFGSQTQIDLQNPVEPNIKDAEEIDTNNDSLDEQQTLISP